MIRKTHPISFPDSSHAFLAALCLDLFGSGSIQDHIRILRQINSPDKNSSCPKEK